MINPELNNKVAIVTGGNAGIGASVIHSGNAAIHC